MPRKKKAPKKVVKQKQKQKQRQSVVVNINQQRKTVAREPRKLTEPPKPVQPSVSTSVSPIFQFPQQYDNTNSIINAIKASQNNQPEIVRDVARVDVAEEQSTPSRQRLRALRTARLSPQVSGLSLEEVQQALPEEPQPQSIPEAVVSVESGGRRTPEKRLVSFNLGEGRFTTSEIPESRTGILQSQKTSQFPVPSPEEGSSPYYTPSPVELIPTKPTEPVEPEEPLSSRNPYIPSQIRETVRASREGGAEELPQPPSTPPPKASELKNNIKAHNLEIKATYKSQGRTEEDAKKDPRYVYLTQRGKGENSKPVSKSDKQLTDELREKDLLGLIPPTSQIPVSAFFDPSKGTEF